MVSNSRPGQFPPGLDDVKILSESHMISLIYIPVVVRRWRQRKDRPICYFMTNFAMRVKHIVAVLVGQEPVHSRQATK